MKWCHCNEVQKYLVPILDHIVMDVNTEKKSTHPRQRAKATEKGQENTVAEI